MAIFKSSISQFRPKVNGFSILRLKDIKVYIYSIRHGFNSGKIHANQVKLGLEIRQCVAPLLFFERWSWWLSCRVFTSGMTGCGLETQLHSSSDPSLKAIKQQWDKLAWRDEQNENKNTWNKTYWHLFIFMQICKYVVYIKIITKTNNINIIFKKKRSTFIYFYTNKLICNTDILVLFEPV